MHSLSLAFFRKFIKNFRGCTIFRAILYFVFSYILIKGCYCDFELRKGVMCNSHNVQSTLIKQNGERETLILFVMERYLSKESNFQDIKMSSSQILLLYF